MVGLVLQQRVKLSSCVRIENYSDERLQKSFTFHSKEKNTCHTNCHQTNCDLSKLFHLLFLLSSFENEQNEGEDWFRSSWRSLRRRVSGCCRSTISTITLWIIILASIAYYIVYHAKPTTISNLLTKRENYKEKAIIT